MTSTEMTEYAAAIAEGTRTMKKAEMVDFMRSYLAHAQYQAPAEVDLASHPEIARTVTTTTTGAIHISRAANRDYDRAEARAMAAALLTAAETAPR